MKNEKIEFIWDTVVDKVVGKDAVESLDLKNVKSGETSNLPIDGVFIFIGHYPNIDLFKDQIKLDDSNYIITDPKDPHQY